MVQQLQEVMVMRNLFEVTSQELHVRVHNHNCDWINSGEDNDH